MAVQALLNLARQDRKEREKKRAVEPPAPLTMEKTTEKENACSATGYVSSDCGVGTFSGTGASSCTACGRLCRCSNCKEEHRKAIRAIDTAAEQEEDTELMGDRTDDGQMTEQEENLQALRVLDTANELLQTAERRARLQGEAEREYSVLQSTNGGEATSCQNGTEWEVIITDALQEAEFEGEEARLDAWLDRNQQSWLPKKFQIEKTPVHTDEKTTGVYDAKTGELVQENLFVEEIVYSATREQKTTGV